MTKSEKYGLLTKGTRHKFPQHSLLLISVDHHGAALEISEKNKTSTLLLQPEQRGLLLMKSAAIEIMEGGVTFLTLNFNRLAKLQVFIDQAKGKERKDISNDKCWNFQPAAFDGIPDGRDIDYWLINQVIAGVETIELFSALLRSNECYELVRFLLCETHANASRQLQELCLRYGLSASHFRRLCRHALGNKTKAELKEWRLVRALFEMINGQNNLTTIAMNQGYSSLSHFSNEVKETIGISPNNLKDIMQAG